MPRITRIFGFDAGHRIVGHESKCANLHGHRYTAHVTVLANDLDPLGRVVDFSVVKELVGRWIDENWDHNMILHEADAIFRLSETDQQTIFGWKSPFIMPPDQNPTAENMAKVLLENSQYQFELRKHKHLRVMRVRLYETPNCYADAIPK